MAAGSIKLQANDTRIATVTFEDGAAGNVSVVVPKEGGVLASEDYAVAKSGDETVAGVKTFSSTPQSLSTPPTGEASYSIPNTYWVKERGVEYKNIIAVSTTINLTSAHFGAHLFLYNGAAQSVNLPLVSQCPAGVTYTLSNNNVGTWYINRAGSDQIFCGETQQTALALTAGATVTLCSRGDYWVVVSGDLNTVGHGQIWTNMTGSKALATAYTNSTGRPIMIVVSAKSTVDSYLAIPGVCQTDMSANKAETVYAIVPNATSYSVTVSGGTPTIAYWAELR